MKKYPFYFFFITLVFHCPKILSWNLEDFKSEYTSPIKDKSATRVAIAGSLATLTTVVFLEDTLIDAAQIEATEKNHLGKYDRTIQYAGELVPNAIYTAGMLGHYSISGQTSKESLQAAEVMAKATAYAGLTTTILKYSIREKRPNSGKERNSFPSGHTTTAFAFASVVAARNPWYIGVPAYVLAGFVGFQRMNKNRHYLHDVMAGATIGTAFGLGMNAYITKRDKDKKSNTHVLLDSDLNNRLGMKVVFDF